MEFAPHYLPVPFLYFPYTYAAAIHFTHLDKGNRNLACKSDNLKIFLTKWISRFLTADRGLFCYDMDEPW